VDSAGIPASEQFAAETEEAQEAQMRRVMKWWDRQRRRDPLFHPWRPFDHPQLGRVEVGGLLFRHQANQTMPALSRIAKGTYRFTLEHARRRPQVALKDVRVDGVGGSVYRVRARVANRGAFPTHVSNRGRSLSRVRGVRVEFHPAAGVKLLSAEGHADLGHLPGVTGSRTLEWFVAAPKRGEVLCEIKVMGGAGGNVRRKVRR